MSDQMSIFDFATTAPVVPPPRRPRRTSRPTARATDPDTSREAAARISTVALTHKEIALAAIRAAGAEGLTDFELEARTGVAQTSIGVRRKALVDAGLVVPLILPGDTRPVRRTNAGGSPSIVWVAVGTTPC